MLGVIMYKYRVVNGDVDANRVVLQDYRGQTYLVRPLSLAPPHGARLEGARPHLGFGILVCSLSGQVYRVIFEEIGGQWVVQPAERLRAF